MTNTISQFEEIFRGADFDISNHEEIIDALRMLREEAASANDEKKANEIWRFESMLRIRSDYISVYEMLKQGRHVEAWRKLEQIEILIQSVKRNSDKDFQEKYCLSNFEQQVGHWQSLFPYTMFFSPAFISGYKTCSICNQKITPRSRCVHEKGYLYNGVVCYHTVHDLEIQEISLVTNPVQKHSIIEKDYNYDGVDYVIKRLKHPLAPWTPSTTTKTLPREVFKKLAEDDSCPCESGKKFSECCWGKNQITIPHIVIEFFHPLEPELAVDLIPYQD